MIEGGPGGQFSASGTFESAIYDTQAQMGLPQAAFNRFSAAVIKQEQTTIKLQLAVASPVGGSCNNAIFNYVGPNGVGGTGSDAYFYPVENIISGKIPLGTYGSYQNPNRCFRYKVYFDTGNIIQSPILKDFNVNISP